MRNPLFQHKFFSCVTPDCHHRGNYLRYKTDRLGMRLNKLEEVTRWILRSGERAKVIKPKELKELGEKRGKGGRTGSNNR